VYGNDVINLDIIILLAHSTSIHCIGEFYKDGIFLHDALNMLTTNTNNALVILVGNMEGNRGWHFLLD